MTAQMRPIRVIKQNDMKDFVFSIFLINKPFNYVIFSFQYSIDPFSHCILLRIIFGGHMEKPIALTTFRRSIYNLDTLLKNKYLTPAFRGQNNPANYGQGYRLLQLYWRMKMKMRLVCNFSDLIGFS
jgi:hypothetical protein